MADKTGIEWTDATWNPVTGCAKVSAGCKHCYAERNWPRMTKLVPAYAGRDFTDVRTHADRLDQPIRWAKRRMIFVNSMSDLFHPSVPDSFIDSVFGVMWACLYGRNEQDGHIFQVLTKRADRMRDYMRADRREAWATAAVHHGGGIDPDGIYDQVLSFEGPHPRIWLGVSVEDQAAADERIPMLLQTPAAVRWISAEPLLGPLRLHLPTRFWGELPGNRRRCNHCCNGDRCDDSTHFSRTYCPFCFGTGGTAPIDWLVVGGESGSKARPMNPEWVRSLRDQCAASGVPFLFKQWGEWIDDDNIDSANLRAPQIADPNEFFSEHNWKDGLSSWRVGKKAAGRLLDGMLHDGYPTL